MNIFTRIKETRMQHPHEVPLSRLQYDPANIRQAGKGADAIYKASLMEKGQITPLIVRPSGDGVDYLVTDGGKRLASFTELAQQGAIKEDHLVKIEVREEDETEARDTSLTTATVHTPPHPVDIFEAFAKLSKDKMSDDDIMQRYNMGRRQFQQTMALGKLAPEIRSAWRQGQIKADAAKIFTLEPNIEKQKRAFEKLKKQGKLHSEYDIRQELRTSDEEISGLVKFVGVDAFRAKGGKVVEDLFGTNHCTSDVKLLEKAVQEKLQSECARLRAEGWSWAEREDDLPKDHVRWQKIPGQEKPTREEKVRLDELDNIINADNDFLTREEENAARRESYEIETRVYLRSYGPAERARSGCVVCIDADGDLNITSALIRPKAAEAEKVEKKKITPQEVAEDEKRRKLEQNKRNDTKTTLPFDLKSRLSECLTRAAAKAVESDVDLGMDILIAGLLCDSGYDSQVQLSVSGELAADLVSCAEFPEMLKRVQKLHPKEKLKAIARIAGASFDFRVKPGGGAALENKEVATVCAAIEPRDLENALQAEFNAADYFKTISKALCLRAIVEALGADAAKPVAQKSAADIVKLAIAKVPPTKWLPPELRTAHYSGPTGKAAKKKK